MPAVTVENWVALPRVVAPPATGRFRRVRTVTTAPSGLEGEGFPVRRAFAGVDLAELDPFVHMDEMGAVDYGPGEPKGTPWHPHRGFETVTYMIDGAFRHQDSTGGGGLITNGDTQWMTAGSGILHIEAPPEELVARGGLFHGLQLWVNLPAAAKWTPPRYQDIPAGRITLATTPDAGVLLRVVAGEVGGIRGPGQTRTPIIMVHATAAPGAGLELPWPSGFNALAYLLRGRVRAGTEEVAVGAGQLVVFDREGALRLRVPEGGSDPTEVVLLGGQPIGEPVAWYGPFVMTTHAELAQAFEDYRAGRLGRVPPES
jgi:redox-sensitive bicupin YhaK (pirin superfamily)